MRLRFSRGSLLKPNPMPPKKLCLSVLPAKLAVCRFDPRAPLPDLPVASSFWSITRTPDELSLVCAEKDLLPGVQSEKGWRCMKLHGPFEFYETGILSSIVRPLAAAAVPIFVISTYDTDYLLVKDGDLETAQQVLADEGHRVFAGE